MRPKRRLDPAWTVSTFAVQHSDPEIRAELRELQAVLGESGACMVLSVPVQTWRQWRDGRRGLSSAARKLIWITWALVCRPDLVTSLFDVATWGRFRTEKREAPPGDYQI
jgi:hypothetical protein